MVNFRILERPAFDVIGKKTWIGGQDNELFGRFWQECQTNGLLAAFGEMRANRPGPQTNSLILGISCVEQDPAKREFIYMIAIEKPTAAPPTCYREWKRTGCQPRSGQYSSAKGKYPSPSSGQRCLLLWNGCRIRSMNTPWRQRWKFIWIKATRPTSSGCQSNRADNDKVGLVSLSIHHSQEHSLWQPPTPCHTIPLSPRA